MKINADKAIWIVENWFCILAEKGKDLWEKEPFLLRPYQKRIIREYFGNPDKNILMEKTRQMGASWVYMALLVIILIFGKNEQMLVLGKREDFVDNSITDPNTLLGKMKYILENLRDQPLFKLVNRKVKSKHGARVPVIETKYLFLINHSRGNIVKGESSATSSGRGGTYSRVIWDEAAFTPRSKQLFASLAPNTRQIVMLSTANGKDNVFYETKDKIERGEIVERWHKIVVHWREYFDEAWYEDQKKKLGNDPRLIAQELDIDYEASGGTKIFHNFTHSNFKPFEFQSSLLGRTVTAFDFGINDKMAGAVIQMHWTEDGPEFYVIDSFEVRNVPFVSVLNLLVKPNEFGLNDLAPRCTPAEFESLKRFVMNNAARRYIRAGITGDQSANARSILTGDTIAGYFFNAGMIFESWSMVGIEEQVLSKIRSYQPRIFIADHLTEMRNMVFGWEYDIGRDGLPLRVGHNVFSDIGDAFKYAMHWCFVKLGV
jgi:hypothetical protein